MRRGWKYVVLLGGIAGVVAFFLPFITFDSRDGMITGGVSAYQIVSGIDSITEVMSGAAPLLATHEDVQAFAKVFNEDLREYRVAMVAFYAPAALLALVGALAGARRRMGRIAGLSALVLGAANAAIWMLFSQVRADQPDETVGLGIGLHLLLAAGIAGILAGLGALLAPDRGSAA